MPHRIKVDALLEHLSANQFTNPATAQAFYVALTEAAARGEHDVLRVVQANQGSLGGDAAAVADLFEEIPVPAYDADEEYEDEDEEYEDDDDEEEEHEEDLGEGEGEEDDDDNTAEPEAAEFRQVRGRPGDEPHIYATEAQLAALRDLAGERAIDLWLRDQTPETLGGLLAEPEAGRAPALRGNGTLLLQAVFRRAEEQLPQLGVEAMATATQHANAWREQRQGQASIRQFLGTLPTDIERFEAANTRLQAEPQLQALRDAVRDQEAAIPAWYRRYPWEDAPDRGALNTAKRNLKRTIAAAEKCLNIAEQLKDAQVELAHLEERLGEGRLETDVRQSLEKQKDQCIDRIRKLLYRQNAEGRFVGADDQPLTPEQIAAGNAFVAAPGIQEIREGAGTAEQIVPQLRSANIIMGNDRILHFETRVVRQAYSEMEYAALEQADETMAVGHDDEQGPQLASGQRLEEGDVVRASKNYGPAPGQPGAEAGPPRMSTIEMDHKGTVRDRTAMQFPPGNTNIQQEIALQQAKLFLKNHAANPDRNIVIRGRDPEQASRVYAALLALGHSQGINRDKISVIVPNFQKPSFFTSNSAYIAEKLPSMQGDILARAAEETKQTQLALKDGVSKLKPNARPQANDDDVDALGEGESIRPKQ